MGRIKRSWQLMKQSYKVLMQDKELMILPVLSGITILLVIGSFAFGIWATTGEAALEESNEVLAYGVLFLFYVVTYTISFFFQAAIVAGASERMNGGDPTLSSALGAATSRLGALLLWGIVAATVGVVLRAIQDRSEILGRIVVGLVGVAWSLATWFMVPVLVMERRPLGDSFKHSWGIFKKTWGESVAGNLGFGLFGFLLALPLIGIVVLLVLAELVIPAIVVGVLGMTVLAAFMSAIQGVYLAAVYRWATTGEAPGGFDGDTMQAAFVPKKKKT